MRHTGRPGKIKEAYERSGRALLHVTHNRNEEAKEEINKIRRLLKDEYFGVNLDENI